jgi:TolB-like protein/tetratricopeptide (TPR) repeat protein
LKRRRVVRAVLGWGILSFAVLQIYEPVMHGLHLPEWTLTLVVVVLGVGFPATFVLAWIFDMGPGGVERTLSAATTPSTPARRIRTGLLLVGLGALFSVPGWVWYARHERAAGTVPPVAGEPVSPHPAAGATAGPSIAVLPFADLSEKHDQEYFADGVAEEILNELAHVEGLRVPGRTSSFWFRGKNVEPAEIGRKLNVANLLQGSVRRSGNRVRVTAQIVNVADGGHLWSETFNRDQADIFAVQDQVAAAVVAALKVKLLGGVPGKPGGRPANIEAYEQYLLGRRLMGERSPASIQGAREAFERAVALDAGYAPAQAGLAQALRDSAGFLAATPEEVDQFTSLGPAAADRAIALDPSLADGYVARAGHRLSYSWDWEGSLRDLEHAIALGSRDASAMREYAYTLAALGRMPEALAAVRRGIEMDPLSSGIWSDLAMLLNADGDFAGAEAAGRRCLQASPDNPVCGRYLGMALLHQGRPAEALALFDRNSYVFHRLDGLSIAYHRMGQAQQSQAALDELVAKYSLSAAFQIAEVHAFRGEPDATFEWLERARIQHDGGLKYVRFDEVFQGLHADPRWKPFLAKLNLTTDRTRAAR